ncbi:MAG: hypothetical protein V1645_03045 [archaeon]
MKLEEEIKSMPEKFVALIIVPSNKFQETSMQILNIMMEKYKGGGYVTVNRPYQSMVKMLRTGNINERNIFFVDCITEYLRENEMVVRNCSFVDSPANLTDIGIALDPIIKDKKHNFIMVDSIDLLSVYNSPELVIKFAHFITGKLRLHDTSGIFLASKEKSDEKLINEMAQFCDRVITLD